MSCFNFIQLVSAKKEGFDLVAEYDAMMIETWAKKRICKAESLEDYHQIFMPLRLAKTKNYALAVNRTYKV